MIQLVQPHMEQPVTWSPVEALAWWATSISSVSYHMKLITRELTISSNIIALPSFLESPAILFCQMATSTTGFYAATSGKQ